MVSTWVYWWRSFSAVLLACKFVLVSSNSHLSLVVSISAVRCPSTWSCNLIRASSFRYLMKEVKKSKGKSPFHFVHCPWKPSGRLSSHSRPICQVYYEVSFAGRTTGVINLKGSKVELTVELTVSACIIIKPLERQNCFCSNASCSTSHWMPRALLLEDHPSLDSWLS